MSYYFRYSISFSNHVLLRIKQRLKLEANDPIELKTKCIELIDNAPRVFEDRNTRYFEVPSKSNFFFVVNKKTNLVVTVTKIELAKQLSLESV